MAAQAFTAIEVECYRYFLAGDSIVNDTAYKLLRMSGVYSYSYDQGPYGSHWFAAELVGLVREDTSARRIFIRVADLWPDSELLLYDFSGEPGPYPETYRFSDYNWDIQVLGVDTIQLEDGPHRTIQLSGVGTIVESLGALTGFMPRRGSVGGLYIEQLVCHTVDSMVTYDLGEILDCECGSDVGLNGLEETPIRLSPSPTSGLCSLQHAPPSTAFEIFTMDGRLLFTGRTSQSGFATIDLTHLPRAVYTIRLLGPAHPLGFRIIRE